MTAQGAVPSPAHNRDALNLTFSENVGTGERLDLLCGHFALAGPHHRMLQPGRWTTRTNTHGKTEWKPPPHLDHGQPRINNFHHPEKLLRDDEDEEDIP